MQKQILYGKDARQKIKDGVNKVADAVITTLGPKGRNAVISRAQYSQNGMQYFQPIVTKDGVTVARNITLTDFLENVGCLMIREASEKTMTAAGDGTTTTCLFVKHLVNEGIADIDGGKNPQEVKKEIEDAVAYVVSQLKKMSIPVSGDIEKIRQVATVSANNDTEIGNLIADAFQKIGEHGVIDIEVSKTEKTEIKISEGMKFDKGYLSPYFITNLAKSECELIDPYILLYDKKLTVLKPLEKLLPQIVQSGKPLLIISDDADGEALAGLAMNAAQGQFRSCIVSSPGFGDSKREWMEDIAALTGATFISDEKGNSLATSTLRELGSAKKVIVSKNETTIIGGDGSAKDELLNTLKMNLTEQTGEEKEATERRVARLEGGVAVLYVGAATETEMKEKRDRCDDAVRATKAAIAEGIVPGAGVALGRIRSESNLVNSVLDKAFVQICENAGVVPAEISKLIDWSNENEGYNAKTGKVEDLLESGIIDPVKVIRCSLENAASTACMILTSETLIADVV